MGKRFTIFGDPVEHSISPKMHGYAIKGFGLDATYDKYHLTEACRMRDAFLSDYDGANVTVPHKEAAYAQCDEVRGIAKEIKAVNTLINEDGAMIGYNTDAKGFLISMKKLVPEAKSALIIGAGGTAKAISYILKANKIEVEILNRSSKRLESFQKLGLIATTWDTFTPKKYDAIINTTSAGLNDEELPAPKELLRETMALSSAAIDVIYNKKTPFLRLADELVLANKDGADMLLYQGVLAFNLFYDNRFKFEEIEGFMRKAFE